MKSHIPDIPHIPSGLKTAAVSVISLYYRGFAKHFRPPLGQNSHYDECLKIREAKLIKNSMFLGMMVFYCTESNLAKKTA